MTTITQADRDAVNAFHSASFTALFNDGGDKQAVGGNMNKAHTLLLEAFAAHREAAEARAREEGAKAMQEAAKAIAGSLWQSNPDNLQLMASEYDQGWKDALSVCIPHIAALDPAQIAGATAMPSEAELTERLRCPAEILSAVELWFFRDLGETQRRQLINWCGFPGVEANGEELQRKLLSTIIAALDPAQIAQQEPKP